MSTIVQIQSPTFSVETQHAVTARLRAINIGLGAMAVVFLVLRFVARWQRQMKLGVDDYLILVALAFLLAGMGSNAVSIEYGLGLNVADITVEQYMMVSKLTFVYEFIYLVTISIVKIAILVTYHRIFNGKFRIATYILCAIIVVWCITFIFVDLFACVPIHATWDLSSDVKCLNLHAIFVSNAIPNILTDLAIIYFPIREVWNLKMKLYQRLSLSFLFLLGSFVVFTSGYRISTLLLIDPTNQTYSCAPVVIWSHIEVCAAIASACLPILRPVVDLFLQKTGIRDKPLSQSNHGTWRSGPAISAASDAEELRVRSQGFTNLGKDDVWRPTENESSDDVPLKSAK